MNIRIKYSRTHVRTPPFLHNICEISYPLHPWPPHCIQPTQVECSCLPMFLIYQPEDGQWKGPKHVVVLYVINYTYLYHHIVVLDRYTHSNLVYYTHNGDDETYDKILELTGWWRLCGAVVVFLSGNCTKNIVRYIISGPQECGWDAGGKGGGAVKSHCLQILKYCFSCWNRNCKRNV